MKIEPIEMQGEFLKELPNMGNSAVRVHMAFRMLREKSRLSYPEDFAWIRAGYNKIMQLSGVKSKRGVRDGIMELAENGWLTGFRRGYFLETNNGRIHLTNIYKVPDKKSEVPPPPIIIALLKEDKDAINKIVAKNGGLYLLNYAGEPDMDIITDEDLEKEKNKGIMDGVIVASLDERKKKIREIKNLFRES